jgi:SNF2 family DNA or RNA helicase
MQIVVTELEKVQDEFLLKIKGATELGKVPVTQLWWSRRKKKKNAFTPAGLIPLDHPNLAWLKWISPKQVDRRSNVIRMTVFELLRLEALFPLVYADKDAESQVLSLTSFELSDEPDLKGLCCSLRPYQNIGVQWLWFLYRHGMSGLLCDDMGLGKTHQTMALIAALRNTSVEPVTFLVVCPTSVIYHWQEKLKQFLPHLRICTFHGLNRSMDDFVGNYDILLTSYGVWRNEKALLEKIQFELAVFDEVQLAKNHQSRLYASLQGVKAKMRLGLTGTPIENQLRELKSLFDLVLPGYMLTDAEYQSYFVKPIEKESNLQRKKQLQKLIRPFVMRRKKEDVLDDLPEKMEEVIHCEMTPPQAHLYHTLLTSAREKIVHEISDGKAQIPYVHIFALLSQLKMVCDHPAVFHKTPWEYRKFESGKWELFLELLEEARDSRQKVVVFSQYLGMLDIIEEHLKENNIGYATIRGATQNRAEQLIKFKEDPGCEVFVASLQAAGLGIDLTAASVVIHYDRWWNAARENQATDRVHRIGQKRGVQVFKLVTKDSFEERIDRLITRKGDLMEDVIGVDDHQVLKSFSREELLELLQINPQQ